jgi:hypothetical protein
MSEVHEAALLSVLVVMVVMIAAIATWFVRDDE